MAATDSSGELFGHGNGNGGVDLNYWSSDMSEAKNSRREKVGDGSGGGNGIGERENLGCGFGVGFDSAQWSESGYGSEPGYRGDAEFGDEFDEEEDDSRFFFWVRRGQFLFKFSVGCEFYLFGLLFYDKMHLSCLYL